MAISNINRQSKRIVLVGHSDGYGGAQTALRKMVDFLTEDGHEIRLVLITDSEFESQPYPFEKIVGLIRHRPKGIQHLFKVFQVIVSGVKVRLFSPDLFISIGIYRSSNLMVKFLDHRCFTLGQDFIANRPKGDKLFVESFNSLKAIAVQSPSMLSHLPVSDSGRINWLPCLPNEPERGILRGNIQSKDLVFCYYGRLAGNKGLDLVIKALANSGQLSKIQFDIWGSGKEEENLKALAKKLNIDDRIHFKGKYPSGNETAQKMASYHALILCSTDTEGLPLTLLESMAYGLPFLTTDVGAIKDCCKENPDVIIVNPTQQEIEQGLIDLKRKLEGGLLIPDRLRAYYEMNFSTGIMKERWRSFVETPKSIFR